MSFFINFYVPFEMSWKEFISDEGEGSGSCVTLAIPVKLQILFFFSLLAFEPERRKKVQ